MTARMPRILIALLSSFSLMVNNIALACIVGGGISGTAHCVPPREPNLLVPFTLILIISLLVLYAAINRLIRYKRQNGTLTKTRILAVIISALTLILILSIAILGLVKV